MPLPLTFWKYGGEKSLLAPDPQQPLGRAVQPGNHPGEGPDREGERDHRHGPRPAEVGQEGVEGLHHARGKADLPGGDHPGDRQRREDEDREDQCCGEENG